VNIAASEKLFAEALQLMPGGVNSPVRAFRSVGGTPRFIARAKGSRIWDVDGNEYIDYVGSWGPMILGHAPEVVIEAVRKALERGTSYGAPTALEVEMARLIRQCFPTIDLVRMVNSGTEATMSAIRVARGFTGREKIVKFDGCWHGHADGLLVRAGSTGLQYGVPDSAGVPAGYAASTLVARYNDLDSVRELLAANSGEVAAIIVEPVAGNMGIIPPGGGFLSGLRQLCTEHGALLILDEVITGFRIALGGAQERYGIKADLTTLGKIIGGGFPVGAYGGRRDIMECVSPLGPVVQAGTLAGNPIAMTAGIATLQTLIEGRETIYADLERKAAALAEGLGAAAATAGVPMTCNRVGSMLTSFFAEGPIENADDLTKASREKYARTFHAMLAAGIAFAPSYCEAAFVSTAHTDEDIARTVEAAGQAFEALAR
jgi:glutamate-1-semialdehyde 2,1-aminomutase